MGGLLAALFTVVGEFPWIQAICLALPLVFVYAFICLSAWYLCQAFPIHPAGLFRLLSVHAVAAFLSSSVWVLLGRGFALLLASFPPWNNLDVRFEKQVPLLAGIGILLFLLAVAVHYSIISFEFSRQAERRELELKIFSRESELRALRAQIHPHFLFNSLNSLSALTSVDPPAARRMCLLLADFLRRSLGHEQHASIPLAEEWSLAENYLAIEQLRFGSRLRHIGEIPPDCRDILVPPLILQPLVENAVNHGIAHRLEEGTISLRARRRNTWVELTLENPCEPDRPMKNRPGLGIANVRRRLATLYGKEARLEVHEESGTFLAVLVLPAVTGSASNGGDQPLHSVVSVSSAESRRTDGC